MKVKAFLAKTSKSAHTIAHYGAVTVVAGGALAINAPIALTLTLAIGSGCMVHTGLSYLDKKLPTH